MVDETKSKRNLYLRRRHRKSESHKENGSQPVDHPAKRVVERKHEPQKPKPRLKHESKNTFKQIEPEEKPVEPVSEISRLEELTLKFTTFLIRHLKI